MKVILHNGTELEAMIVFGSHEVVQGESRECLSFVFPASSGLEVINASFSEENCESIRLVENNGDEHVHTGYVIRAALTLTPGEDSGRVTVIMAKRGYAEERLLELRRQTEETAAQITDTQLALCEVYEMMLGSGTAGEGVSDNG